jgi:hypothetical protein
LNNRAQRYQSVQNYWGTISTWPETRTESCNCDRCVRRAISAKRSRTKIGSRWQCSHTFCVITWPKISPEGSYRCCSKTLLYTDRYRRCKAIVFQKISRRGYNLVVKGMNISRPHWSTPVRWSSCVLAAPWFVPAAFVLFDILSRWASNCYALPTELQRNQSEQLQAILHH